LPEDHLHSSCFPFLRLLSLPHDLHSMYLILALATHFVHSLEPSIVRMILKEKKPERLDIEAEMLCITSFKKDEK